MAVRYCSLGLLYLRRFCVAATLHRIDFPEPLSHHGSVVEMTSWLHGGGLKNFNERFVRHQASDESTRALAYQRAFIRVRLCLPRLSDIQSVTFCEVDGDKQRRAFL